MVRNAWFLPVENNAGASPTIDDAGRVVGLGTPIALQVRAFRVAPTAYTNDCTGALQSTIVVRTKLDEISRERRLLGQT